MVDLLCSAGASGLFFQVMNQYAKIKINVLRILSRMPVGYPQQESALRAELRLMMSPEPGSSDVGLGLGELEDMNLIGSTRCILTGEKKYSITDAGRLMLSEFKEGL